MGQQVILDKFINEKVLKNISIKLYLILTNITYMIIYVIV